MLSLAKRIPESQTALREGQCQRREASMGREFAGRTVGLVGLGHVGTRVAGILKAAFSCRVLAYDPAPRRTDLFVPRGGKDRIRRSARRMRRAFIPWPIDERNTGHDRR